MEYNCKIIMKGRREEIACRRRKEGNKMASSEAALVRSLWCPREEAEDMDVKRER